MNYEYFEPQLAHLEDIVLLQHERLLQPEKHACTFFEPKEIYTIGKRGASLNYTDLSLVPVPRGGLETWHGPGQLVIFPQIDLSRNTMGLKKIIDRIISPIPELMKDVFDINDLVFKPGVGCFYNHQKVLSYGLYIKNRVLCHGLSLQFFPYPQKPKIVFCGNEENLGSIYNFLMNESDRSVIYQKFAKAYFERMNETFY